MKTIKEYKTELTAVFRRNTVRGFADWRCCRNLAYDVERFLDRAAFELLHEGREKELYDLVLAAYVKWGKTNKDDSGGETQGFIYGSAFAIWNEIYDKESASFPHAKMLDGFLKKMNGTMIDYMEEFLLTYVMEHFREMELLEKKIAWLRKKITEKEAEMEERRWAVYEIERFRKYILQIYGEQKRPIEEIRAYAKEQKRADAQELLAQIELDYGNRKECMDIYSALADSDKPEWEREKYKETLKELYKKFGMQTEYREMVEALLGSRIGDQKIWEEYKSLIPAKDWAENVHRLFSSFKPGDCRPLEWYAMEGQYDRIMTAVEQGGASYLYPYEDELRERYPERCLAVLVRSVSEFVPYAQKRSDYRHIAADLKWIRTYPGGREKAAELAQYFRELYPRRTAMLDELKGF